MQGIQRALWLELRLHELCFPDFSPGGFWLVSANEGLVGGSGGWDEVFPSHFFVPVTMASATAYSWLQLPAFSTSSHFCPSTMWECPCTEPCSLESPILSCFWLHSCLWSKEPAGPKGCHYMESVAYLLLTFPVQNRVPSSKGGPCLQQVHFGLGVAICT